ncbi:MAG: ASKHA domain-containing protein [Treponema sp.]|nr:ASKHA domain-containing protein [Treponema sp.]
MPIITFKTADNSKPITIEAKQGSSLLEAARHGGVFIETPCGGKGTCKKCLVQIKENNDQSVLICQTSVPEYPITVILSNQSENKIDRFENFDDQALSKYYQNIISDETFIKKVNLQVSKPALLDGLSDADRFIKAFQKVIECQYVEIPLNILAELPEKLREKDGELTVYYYLNKNTAYCVSLETPSAYGIAVDIGTTTVAIYLIDLESKKIIAVQNTYNKQIECGLDVISRINYAKKNLNELRKRILDTINELIDNVCNKTEIKPSQILCLSLAGNTTMTHLLLGVIPEYLRLSPYTPAVFQPQIYTANLLGINICQNAPALFAPAVGSYVGGDITSGLLCTKLTNKSNKELILFIDIGTNGEIVLGNDDFIFACACSAGPAFEGAGIKHGVRAQKGAVEKVSIDTNLNTHKQNLQIQTIGGAPPIGICGSGIISVIAELFKNGIIDSAGKFSQKNGEYALFENISINETDIDNFIRAKGAIFSACQTLLDSVNMSFNDLDKVYVAGGFGRFLDLEDARTIGLLPRLPDEKFVFLGNSSLIGAYLCLVSQEQRKKMHELTAKITYIDLSSEAKYMDHYTGALFLPHTDKKLFE